MAHQGKDTAIEIAGFVLGAVIGPFLLTAIATGLDHVFRYKVWNEDSYGFILLFTVPGGIWLGAFTGLAFAWLGRKEQEVAGVLCIVASLFYIVPSAFLFGISSGFSVKVFAATLLTDSMIFWLMPLWSIGLIVWGIALQRHPRI